jgi:hypothetical protein
MKKKMKVGISRKGTTIYVTWDSDFEKIMVQAGVDYEAEMEKLVKELRKDNNFMITG